MANNTFMSLALASIICLIVGAFAGVALFPQTVEKVVTKEVQVPGPEKTVEVPVEKIVEKEIVKEVPVKTGYRDEALKSFQDELADKDSLQVCNGVSYDIDQVKLSKVYDEFSVSGDDKDYTVKAKAKFKYLDSDVSEKCYNTFEFTVRYQEDEDPVVTVL